MMLARLLSRLIVAMAALTIVSTAVQGATPTRSKVLIIGIDGCRGDALKAAETPHLDALVRDGAMVEGTRIQSPRFNKSDTVSGPGWSSILTGVWADKHGVLDNRFRERHFQDYPSFFERVKQHDPHAETVSLVTWPPINEQIVTAVDVAQSINEGKKEFAKYDQQATRAAAAILGEKDPTAMFIHFNLVDETGHRRGFSPEVKPYLKAIEQVDGHIGQFIKAVHDRPDYDKENWLVLVCTDHGGRGLQHGHSREYPEVTETWLIASGKNFRGKNIQKPTYLVDVAPTALVHLGVKIDPQWKLDGTPLKAIEKKPATSSAAGVMN